MLFFGSVCSGIEAASMAFYPLGWRAAWLSEIEPFPSAVLAHHYPDVPNLGDMTRLPASILTGEATAPDVLCGGTPCQAFSVAGMREGLNDPRGQLTIKFVELADAIDHVRTRAGKPECITLWENVPGVLSDRGNAFGCFLGALAGENCELQPPGGKWKDAGCVYGPKRAIAWRVLDAQYFGLAQRRRRVFVVASARNDFDPCAVLFESDGLRRDTAPRREARQVAPTIPSRSTAGGGLGTDFDCDGGVITTHTLRGEGFDASEDCMGRGTPLVPGTVGTLSCNTGPNGHDAGNFACNQAVDAGHILPVPVGVTIHGTDPTVQKVASYDEVAQCLRARTPGNIDNSSTTVVQQPVSFAIQAGALRTNPNSGPDGVGVQSGYAYTLEARAEVQAVAVVSIQDVRGTDKAQNGRGWNDDGTAYTLDTHATQGVALPIGIFQDSEFGVQRYDTAGTLRAGRIPEHQMVMQPPTLTSTDRHGVATCGAFFAGQGAKAGSIAYSTDVAPTLKASDSGTNRTPSVHINAHPVEAFTTEQTPKFNDDCALTLTKQSPTGGGQIQSVMSAMQVRRLTPVECERLMGFPDGYTAIPWRKKPASECPDGPRYRALGNSWAVPNVRWIGERIQRECTRLNLDQTQQPRD